MQKLTQKSVRLVAANQNLTQTLNDASQFLEANETTTTEMPNCHDLRHYAYITTINLLKTTWKKTKRNDMNANCENLPKESIFSLIPPPAGCRLLQVPRKQAIEVLEKLNFYFSQNMETKQTDLQSLSVTKLFKIYTNEVNENANIKEYAKPYGGIVIKKNGNINKPKSDADAYEMMKQDLIDEINAIRREKQERERLQREWEEVTREIEPEAIPNEDDYEDLQRKFYELQNENQRLRDYIRANIPNQRDKLKPLDARARSHLKAKEDTAAIWRNVIDDERQEFRKAHHNMSYEEYNNATKDSRQNVVDILSEINADKNTYYLNFLKCKPEELDEIKSHLVDWWANKIGDLTFANKYKLQFRIKDDWKTVPLNQDSFGQMLEKLQKGSFVYDMEKMPTWQYEAGKPITELPEWSLFDAIKVAPLGHYDGIYKDNGGHFFKYLACESLRPEILETLARLQIFTTLTLDGKTQRPELDDCCFIYAVKQTGKFTEEQLNLMRMRVRSRYLSKKSINEIATEFKFRVNIHRIDLEAVAGHAKRNFIIGFKDATPEMTFNFDLYDEHYMIHIDRLPISTDYVKHIDDAPADAIHKRYRLKRGKYIWESFNNDSYLIPSDKLVIELMRQNKFTPITYATASIMKTTLYENVKDADFPLEYDENACTKLIEPKTKKPTNKKADPYGAAAGGGEKDEKDENPPSYWYADFEADTKGKSGEVHTPFMCCVQSANGEIKETFKGPECARFFLNFLPDNAVCYFHNLAYDWCMFNRLASSIQKVIKKGSKVYQAKILFYRKRLTFKDSYAVFMCKLSVLPKSFGLEGIKKELFPYKYYTMERLKTNIGDIYEAGEYEDKRWSLNDCVTFLANIDSIEGCRLSETTFDMYKYAEFYCQQDVRILRESFEKLCEGFQKEFGLNVKTMITTPAIANDYFRRNVYEPNGNIYEVGGHVREFMSRAIYGGRCMCAFNKCWHTTRKIYDYDAVSLYPSAMRRLWTVEGRPEVLNVPDSAKVWTTLPDYLQPYNSQNGVGAFVIQITITAVGKHYAFPLIVKHTPEGNLNNDIIKEGETVTMVVDNIALEDLIEFQQISFKVIKGYVWNGKRDYHVQEVIQHVFEMRLKYKAEKNPLEQLYKLIMNSAYGKTIQKPVDFDLKYLSKWRKNPEEPSKYDRYWQKNYNKIIEVPFENDDCAFVKVRSPVDKHFNLSLFGIQVLSMSKRIMNEVMCLAYDLGCHIYYQDTDSFMIECDDLPKLEQAFGVKYGRELRGKKMGNFHSDFPTINGHDEVPWSIEAYFIAKKVYVHHIQDSTGETAFVIRGKGLTQESIKKAGKEYGGLMNVYEKLFKGRKVVFDLTANQPSFDMCANFTVATRKAFKRKVKTTYKEGKREDYFN